MYRDKLRKHLIDFKKNDYLKVEEPGKKSEEIDVDCSFGDNPFGHTERIQIQNKDKTIEVGMYPELGAFKLREKIIEFWSPYVELNYENISMADGSMGSINSINSLYIDVGDKVLGYSPQFPEYVDSLEIHGGKYSPVLLKKEDNYKFDSKAIINCLNKNLYKLVYIDNPNNPTGQIIPILEIEAIIRKASEKNIIVIIDEAYGDYMPMENSAITLISKYSNFYVLKSFSKAYSLAGLRIGYIVGSQELMSNYSIIDDYLINRVALDVAGEALNDTKFLSKTIEKTKIIKAEILRSISSFKVLETDVTVPIFTIISSDEDINLYEMMRKFGINTSSGFRNLKRNAVRIRIPQTSEGFIELLKKIEKNI